MAAPTDAAERSQRRRIQWDEENLTANEEWQKAHPVTMHIDEPKTPYNHDDGQFPEEDADHDDGTWADAAYNHVAQNARHTAPQGAAPPAVAETTPSRPRLQLVVEPTAEAEQQAHDKEFKHMRRAVYADEGKAFLARKAELEQLGDDDDADAVDAPQE